MNDEVLPVTVVVPTWQRPDWLRKCLSAVASQRPRPAHTLVVGRQEDGAARAVAKEFEGVEWLTVDRPGHVEPVRRALSAVRTPYVAILDDDAEPAVATWLEALVGAFTPTTACVGGPVRNVGESRSAVVPRRAGQMTWYGRVPGNVARRADTTPTAVASVPEGNCMWRTEVLRQLRMSEMWDSGDGSMYGLELCLQARRLGWLSVLSPDAPIVHHLAPRKGVAPRDDYVSAAYSYSRNMTVVSLRHLGLRLVPFLMWSLLVGERHFYGLLSAARDLTSPSRERGWKVVGASMRGRFAGLREVRQMRAKLPPQLGRA